MVQLRLGADSGKGLEKKQSIDGSLNLSAGRETQTQLQSDLASDDQTYNEDKQTVENRLTGNQERDSGNNYDSQKIKARGSPPNANRS